MTEVKLVLERHAEGKLAVHDGIETIWLLKGQTPSHHSEVTAAVTVNDDGEPSLVGVVIGDGPAPMVELLGRLVLRLEREAIQNLEVEPSSG